MLTPSLTADSLLLGILGFIAAHAYSLYRRGRWLVLDPLNAFWAGVLAIYILQPIDCGDTLVQWYSVETLEWSLLAVLWTVTFVIIGYEASVGIHSARFIPAPPSRVAPLNVLIGSLALMSIGLLSYVLIIHATGGFECWSSMGTAKRAAQNVSGYIGALQILLPTGILLLLFHVEMHRTRSKGRLVAWALGGLMLLFTVYVGSRFGMIRMAFILLAAWHIPRRTNPRIAIVFTVFLALLVATNFMARYRQNFRNLSFNLQETDANQAFAASLPRWLSGHTPSRSHTISRGLEFSCVMAALELVPERVDFNYGYSELEFFTRAIPRAMWPEKRYPHYEAFTPIYATAGLTTSTIDHPTQFILHGPVFTFVGHWYAVGGPIALAIAGVFTGALFRAIRYTRDRAPSSEGGMILYTSLVLIGFTEAAGTPLFWIFTIPFSVIPLLAILNFRRLPNERTLVNIRLERQSMGR